MSEQSAVIIAHLLVTEVISRFGVPLQIHTDQGRNFESVLFKEVCRLLDIEKTRTTPLHPQSDGMVERLNRTLEAMLSKFVQTDYQTGYRRSISNPEDSQGKAQVCTPRPPERHMSSP